MTTIKATTKAGKNWLSRRKEGVSLCDVYSKPSFAKERAYNHCREMCYAENGSDFRILSHNCQSFTVAWDSPLGLRIETSRNSYLITK